MDTKTAIQSLNALAQESRLAIYRALVEAGPNGMPAMKIAEQLGAPASSMSFHFKELHHAGLITSRQDGRFIIYAANFDRMSALLAFLSESCCAPQPCPPALAMCSAP
jgi:ArsR family transcriptional regulator, arsenate/arsenite/antimonite-responsive transcriptional repressor